MLLAPACAAVIVADACSSPFLDGMPLYEVMCITSMAATHKHVINTMKRVHGAVVERGGLVRGIEHLGLCCLVSFSFAFACSDVRMVVASLG